MALDLKEPAEVSEEALGALMRAVTLAKQHQFQKVEPLYQALLAEGYPEQVAKDALGVWVGYEARKGRQLAA